MSVQSYSLGGNPMARAQVNSLSAIQRMNAQAHNAGAKLATQERILGPGEDTLAFVTSRKLVSEVQGMNAVARASQANVSALGVGIQGLEAIRTQLDSIKANLLKAQAADAEMRTSIQSQIDGSLAIIDSTAARTRFGGRALLSGESAISAYASVTAAGAVTDFAFNNLAQSLTQSSGIQQVQVHKVGSGLPTRILNDGRTVLSLTVEIASSQKATKGEMTLAAGQAGGFAEFRVTGKLGSAMLRIDSTASTLAQLSGVAKAFNAQSAETGVALAVDGAGVKLTTVGFGDDDFLKVELVAASIGNTAAFGGVSSAEAVGTTQTAVSKSAVATINGIDVRLGGEFGKTANFNAYGFDVDIDFGTGDLTNATVSLSTQVNMVLDRGVAGVTGSSGSSDEVVYFGIGSFASSNLGRNGNGIWAATEASSGSVGSNTAALGNRILASSSLAELRRGGLNDVNSGRVTEAVESINRAVSQVLAAQSRMGALQAAFGNAAERAQVLGVQFAESNADIIGVDAATEIAALIGGQMGVQSASAVMSQTRSVEANVFSLLR